jgi:hypothetical protein
MSPEVGLSHRRGPRQQGLPSAADRASFASGAPLRTAQARPEIAPEAHIKCWVEVDTLDMAIISVSLNNTCFQVV